jgi:hypothetical protein
MIGQCSLFQREEASQLLSFTHSHTYTHTHTHTHIHTHVHIHTHSTHTHTHTSKASMASFRKTSAICGIIICGNITSISTSRLASDVLVLALIESHTRQLLSVGEFGINRDVSVQGWQRYQELVPVRTRPKLDLQIIEETLNTIVVEQLL